MPIITKEQIKTLLWLIAFACVAMVITLLLRKGDILTVLPEKILAKPRVKIRLQGAVPFSGVREVERKRALWQIVGADNPLASFIDWQRISLTEKVYDGMDVFVPLRKLRTGETITLMQIIDSKGKLLLALPCDFSLKVLNHKGMKKLEFSTKENKLKEQQKYADIEKWWTPEWIKDIQRLSQNSCVAAYLATSKIEE